jgi:aminoglycoside 6'-N-acetyltransferase I
MVDINLRRATPADKADWVRMRKGIWPDWGDDDLGANMDQILASENDFVVFACDADQPIGLTEVKIKDHAEGCETSPVGYIEGWFVQEEYRGKGVVGLMTQTAENWLRAKGCAEVASDTWLENESSIRAHVKLGYMEVERLVHFVKKL